MAHLALVALIAAASFAETAAQLGTKVFFGSTPCDEAIRTLLAIPREANAELIEWELTLAEAGDSRGAATYHLRYRFGPTRPNQPGLDSTAAFLERRGTWRMDATAQLGVTRSGEGARRLAAGVVALDNGLLLLKVSDSILHALAPDGSLMVGNGGWSYTLSRRDAVEKDVDTRLVAADPGDAARTTTRATGPTVFGIFDGRTPCQGIASELSVPVRPGCWKAKWRLTLFQDPNTLQPTRYRLEGTLYGSRPREGSWRIVRGVPALPDAEVYELASADGESPALLLKGDDRVLFFLDRNRRPMTGNARHAYTLDRIPSSR
jgi:hypothetical protein